MLVNTGAANGRQPDTSQGRHPFGYLKSSQHAGLVNRSGVAFAIGVRRISSPLSAQDHCARMNAKFPAISEALSSKFIVSSRDTAWLCRHTTDASRRRLCSTGQYDQQNPIGHGVPCVGYACGRVFVSQVRWCLIAFAGGQYTQTTWWASKMTSKDS